MVFSLLFGGQLWIGDVPFAASDGEAPCDLALIQGHCVVDESLLTGEAMPVTKVEMPTDDRQRHISRAEFRKHYIFAGTRIVHATGPQLSNNRGAACVVVATGGNTARGEMLQSLLYGNPKELPIQEDVPKVFTALLSIALFGFLLINYRFGFELGPCLSGAFLVVGLVNPLLSVALIAGQLASAARLKKQKQVHCRDIQRLALAGAVNMMLFDKTGTLTEQGLELVGCLPPSPAGIGIVDPRSITVHEQGLLPKELHMSLALAHDVRSIRPTRVGDEHSSEGELIGHELELRMVRASRLAGWTYDWSQQPKLGARHRLHGSFEVLKLR